MNLSDAARAILGAVVALGALQFALLVALVATRIPAMIKARIRPQAATKEAMATLPAPARNVADNYTNLFEAPTLFFALCITLVLLGHADWTDAGFAWAYVALRAAHSAVQASINIVRLRFYLFAASWVVLAVMLVRAVTGLIAPI